MHPSSIIDDTVLIYAVTLGERGTTNKPTTHLFLGMHALVRRLLLSFISCWLSLQRTLKLSLYVFASVVVSYLLWFLEGADIFFLLHPLFGTVLIVIMGSVAWECTVNRASWLHSFEQVRKQAEQQQQQNSST